MLVLLYIMLFMLYALCLFTLQLCFTGVNIGLTMTISLICTFITYLVIRHYIYTPVKSESKSYHTEQALFHILRYDNDEEERILTH